MQGKRWGKPHPTCCARKQDLNKPQRPRQEHRRPVFLAFSVSLRESIIKKANTFFPPRGTRPRRQETHFAALFLVVFLPLCEDFPGCGRRPGRV